MSQNENLTQPFASQSRLRMPPFTEWAHERFMDVQIQVVRVQYTGPRYMKVKIRWVHKTRGPYNMSQTITIYADQYRYWKRV